MRLFFSLLLLLTVGITAAQDATPESVTEFTDHPARVVTNINGLNVRSTPAIEADNILGRLRPGQQVHVLAREGDWQQVRNEDGLVGWSHSDYLIDLPPLTLAQDAAIINAVRWADYAELQRLLADGADPNAQDEGSWSALILAASSGNARIVELLLAEGADPNLPTSWGAPPLLWATSNEHADVVALLLAAGATTNLQDVYGYTAFMWATEYGLTDIVELLLAEGADPNLQNNIGKSALHWAAEFGHADVVELLLAAGADVNLRNNVGKTAAQVARDHGYPDSAQLIDQDIELLAAEESRSLILNASLITAARRSNYSEVRRLLAEGADPDAQDEGSWSPLLITSSSGNASIVALLLAAGADPNLPTSWGAPPLLWATSNEHADVVALLLAAGATTNLQDVYGYTAFMWATEYGLTDIVELLLAEGADPNLQNNIGKSALHWAAEFGHADVVELLLAAGADVNLRNNVGKTAAQVARDHGYQDIAQRTEQVTQPTSTGNVGLIPAVRDNDLAEIERLLAAGADINLQDEDGWTALHWAALNRYSNIVTHLLAAGADIDLRNSDGLTAAQRARKRGHHDIVKIIEQAAPSGSELINAVRDNDQVEVERLLAAGALPNMHDENRKTALQWAALYGYPSIVAQLLAAGANANLQSEYGWTALLSAAIWAPADVSAQLLAAGADVNLQSETGWAALILATDSGRDIVVELLLIAGADVNLQNNYGWSALMLAAYGGHADIVDSLLSAGADVNLRRTDIDIRQTAAEWARERGYHDIATTIEQAQPARAQDADLDAALVTAARQSDYAETERLLANGADPNARDSDGYTSLYYALPGYPRADGIAVARLLLDHGADPNLPVAYGRTILLDMAWRGAADEAALLLEYGADPNQSNHLGITPLFEAARGGYLAVVDILLAGGADLNHQDNFGYTALIHAITEEQQRGDWKLDFQIKRLDLAVLQRLIEAGADLNLKTNAGGNAFSYTTNIEVMNLLQNAEPNPIQVDDIGLTGLMLGAIAGDEMIVKSFLGIDDPNAVDATGINTALRYAVRMGHPQIATLLLNNGADLNQANIFGETVLYWAIQAGEDQFADLLTRLRQQRVELDALITSGHYDTPLLLAVRQGNEKIVETLLRAGANPDLSDKHQVTPLMEASGRDYTEIVNLLLDAGADPDLRDSRGRTAEDYDKYASPARGGVWIWVSYGEVDPE